MDPDAFDELYQREWVSVFRVALALTNDWDDASDISQETFRRVWERREAIDWDRPARPLVLVTARRLAVDRFRRLARTMRIGRAEHVVGTATLGSDGCGHDPGGDRHQPLAGLDHAARFNELSAHRKLDHAGRDSNCDGVRVAWGQSDKQPFGDAIGGLAGGLGDGSFPCGRV